MINYELPQMKYPEQKGLVSIIVPIYNTDKTYLRECLNSILAQTFTNWEAILVNDGSTDDIGKIVDEYAGKDSRFIAIHKQNGGTLLARKTGLENSKGEFIANLDHDDTYHPQFLEKMYVKIMETNADFVWCEREYGSLFSQNVDYKWSTDISENISAYIMGRFEKATWNKLIRRKIYIKVRFPIMNFVLAEDPIQMVQVVYYSRLAIFIPESLYFHIRAGASNIQNINYPYYIKSRICLREILQNLFNGTIPENVKYCLWDSIAYRYFLLNKNQRTELKNKLEPFLPECIKYEKKLNLRICLLLANKGIEFPFKLREEVRKTLSYIRSKCVR